MPAASAALRQAASIPAKNRSPPPAAPPSPPGSDAVLIGLAPAWPNERLGAKLAQLAPPTMQNVRVDFTGAGHFVTPRAALVRVGAKLHIERLDLRR